MRMIPPCERMSLSRADEHPETRGVQEGDLSEVDHEITAAALDLLVEVAPQRRGCVDVDLAAHVDHRPRPLRCARHGEIHQ
jgi:hypothetical protein